MMRVARRTRIGTISMAAALLSLGAGVALLGASCNNDCPPGGCWDPADATCPWRCTQYPWDGTKYSIDGFRFWAPLVVWIGDPRDAPDCLSVNYYHAQDYYQDPKSLDRCPRCVAEPLEHDHFSRIDLLKGGLCSQEPWSAVPTIAAFVLPAMWDGRCVSERVVLDRAAEDADFVLGSLAPNRGVGCLPSLSQEDVAASWGTLVRACEHRWGPDRDCRPVNSTCQPEMPPGFRDCIRYTGDEEVPACPPSFPELVQAHTGVEGCTRCTYKDVASTQRTTSTFAVYADEECTQPIPITTEVDPHCGDLPPGTYPRSISATYSVEHFAPCEIVGGEQEGEITPGPLVSFCCTPVGGTF